MLLHPSNNPIIEAGRQRRAWPTYSCHGLRAASVAVVCLFWCSILHPPCHACLSVTWNGSPGLSPNCYCAVPPCPSRPPSSRCVIKRHALKSEGRSLASLLVFHECYLTMQTASSSPWCPLILEFARYGCLTQTRQTQIPTFRC